MDVLKFHVIVNEQDLRSVLRRVKKFQKDGFYVEVDELSFGEVKKALFSAPFRFFKNYEVLDNKKQAFFSLKIFGPKIVVKQLRDHLLIQVESDSVSISQPLTKAGAINSAFRTCSKLAYICKIVDVVKK